MTTLPPPLDLAFLDSNIWLYALIAGQDLHKAQIATTYIQHTMRIVISVQVINEVSANILKNRLMDESALRALIDTFYARYTIVAYDRALFHEASLLREEIHVSYWDSLIIAAALFSGSSILYSEDMQHGQRIRDQLTILNPFQ